MDAPATDLDRSDALPGDLALGTFTTDAPWDLTDTEPVWRDGDADRRRALTRRLRTLVKPPRIPPLRRAVRVARVLGFQLAVWYLIHRRGPNSRAELSRRLRESAEVLGPTYIKLGQIISAGEGVFPEELVAECRKCPDQVPAVDFEQVRTAVEREYGRPLHEVFLRFEPVPLAAASIAQVHAATLRSGEDVVVKVQRPGIEELVTKDLEVLAFVAPHLVGRIPIAALANPPALVELFAETIIEELDFRLEAANMLDVAGVLRTLEQTDFVVPRPHPELVTERVMVMQRLSGFRFDDAVSITAAGLDTHGIIRTMMLGFLEGAFLHGVFHGDLHGGNLFVRPDGTTALLDFGITGRLTQAERMAFLRMMMTATMNDTKGQVAALRDLGALPADTDVDAVVADLGLDSPLDPTKVSPEELVAEIQRVIKALLAYGARMPKPLMLYVKNLIFIDGAIANLAPDLDLFAEVTHIATHFATTHGQTIVSQLGMTQTEWELDLDGVKAGFGVNPDEFESLTYAELQERRELIRKRLGTRALGN